MKIGNLYNLPNIKSFADKIHTQFTDSAFSGTVLARNLTMVDPKIFEKKLPELTFVNSGIQASNIGGWNDKIVSLRTMVEGGFADAGDRTSDKGKISLSAEQSDLRVVQREAEIEWSMSDIERASLQGYNIISKLMAGTNAQYLREIDQVGLIGNGTTITTGLLNESAFPVTAAAGAAATLNPQELYDEIAELINTQWDAVEDTPEYKATRVTMPSKAMKVYQSQMMDTASGVGSVLEALKTNFPDITFTSTFRANDVGGSSRTVAHSVSDESMIMRIPQPLMIGEIIKTGSFSSKSDALYRIAGLDVLEQTSGAILTGL